MRLASNLVVKLNPHRTKREVSLKFSGKFSGMPCRDMNRSMGSRPRPKSSYLDIDRYISSTLDVWFCVIGSDVMKRFLLAVGVAAE